MEEHKEKVWKSPDGREVRVAGSAGFCFGVKRAVDGLSDLAAKARGPVYTYGPIIHNETVVKDFEKQGVDLYDEKTPLSSLPKGTMVLRSHGVSRQVVHDLENAGFQISDATCPFVGKIHRTVEQYSRDGYYIIILGDPSHPEVEGITGWVVGDRYKVISTEEEAEALFLPPDTKVCVVSQTTFRFDKFEKLVEMIVQKGYDTYAQNTICNATELRQREAAELSAWADVMLVIGGKNSSNSRKLFDICRDHCGRTYFLQTAEELSVPDLYSIQHIGITAGASTPEKIIEEVFKKCQK